MTRKQFITEWVARREAWCRAQTDMRVSEKVMTMADAPAEAARLWRKHRHHLERYKTLEEFLASDNT